MAPKAKRGAAAKGKAAAKAAAAATAAGADAAPPPKRWKSSFPALEDLPQAGVAAPAPPPKRSKSSSPAQEIESEVIDDGAAEAEGAAAPAPKQSAPSRGQRYIFQRDFNTLPKKVQDEYNRIRLSMTPGKTQAMNQIIMAATKNVTGYSGQLDTRLDFHGNTHRVCKLFLS